MNKKLYLVLNLFFIAEFFVFSQQLEDFDKAVYFLHQNLSGYEQYLSLEENTNLLLFQEALHYFEEEDNSQQKEVLITDKNKIIFEYKEKAESKFIENITSSESLLRMIKNNTGCEVANEQKELDNLKIYFSENTLIPEDLSIFSKIQVLYSQSLFNRNLAKNFYTVQEGDCFVTIAAKKEIYGTYSKWKEIYKANKHKLKYPENPELIYPGTVLEIPKL